MPARDALFSAPLGSLPGQQHGFRFDQSVVDVFPDMLERSIPGYHSIVLQSGLLAARFAQPETRLFDLGCSLGATALAMRAALSQARSPGELAGISIHGIDNSAPMLRRLQDLLDTAETEDDLPIHLHEADLVTTPLSNASVVAMNFTLQFVAPDARDALMQRLAEAVVPGGVLILSEKIRFDDPSLDALQVDLYHDFKRANGYSELEISQKRTALENVLVPDTIETHYRRLQAAGFARATVWFQSFNFVSMIAIRGE